jgi:hypothetical protein
MGVQMQNIFLDLAVKVAASVCRMDGVISEAKNRDLHKRNLILGGEL